MIDFSNIAEMEAALKNGMGLVLGSGAGYDLYILQPNGSVYTTAGQQVAPVNNARMALYKRYIPAAADIPYDNTVSGLTAETAQDAIDEVADDVKNLADTAPYIVTFGTDGGSPPPAWQLIRKGGKVAEPADPTKEGYTFSFWSDDGETEWIFTTDTVTADTTLTAVYTANG